MREVVSNTSPLQYLHQTNLLDLLPALYGEEHGHLPAVAPVIEQLEALNFRLDPVTRAAVLQLGGED